MRLRSTISGADTLPEMHTSTPQPECMRIPKAAFSCSLRTTHGMSSYTRDKVGRDALIGGNGQQISKECCAAPCLVNTSSQIMHLRMCRSRAMKTFPIWSALVSARRISSAFLAIPSTVFLNTRFLTKACTLKQKLGTRIAARLFHQAAWLVLYAESRDLLPVHAREYRS